MGVGADTTSIYECTHTHNEQVSVIVEAAVGFACVAIIRSVAVSVVGNARHEVVLALALIVRCDEGSFVGEALLARKSDLTVDVGRELGNCRGASYSEFALSLERLPLLRCNLAAHPTAHGEGWLCRLGARVCCRQMRYDSWILTACGSSLLSLRILD